MTSAASNESTTLSPEAKLRAVKARIEKMLCDRLSVLNEEASILAADMEALLGRIGRKGHVAKVSDLKAGRWYRTASDLRLLQDLYSFVCGLLGEPETVLRVSPSDDDSDGTSTDRDEVSETL